jgi:CubicO group peptidase (beta-lactamase class C family)
MSEASTRTLVGARQSGTTATESISTRKSGCAGPASVVVAGSGIWSGAAGVHADGYVLSPGVQLLRASVAKTVTAAEVLHLVEEGFGGRACEGAVLQ